VGTFQTPSSLMNTILVPVDFSDATPGVIEQAVQLATAFSARVVLLHVIEPEPDLVGLDGGPPPLELVPLRSFEPERLQLERLRQTIADQGREVLAVQTRGSTARRIVEEATAQNAGWIVMGSHGHGALYEILVGSVTTGVLKDTPCPVVVVPVRGK